MPNLYDTVVVAVLGWCPPTVVDIDASNNAVSKAFSMVMEKFPAKHHIMVSGLTDVGVHSRAYREAEALHWELHGVACARAFEHKVYPVKKAVICGRAWDDFEEFDGFVQHVLSLNAPIVLLNIGGGYGANTVMEAFGHLGAYTYEYKLERQ